MPMWKQNKRIVSTSWTCGTGYLPNYSSASKSTLSNHPIPLCPPTAKHCQSPPRVVHSHSRNTAQLTSHKYLLPHATPCHEPSLLAVNHRSPYETPLDPKIGHVRPRSCSAVMIMMARRKIDLNKVFRVCGVGSMGTCYRDPVECG